jgi:hypothetical protein
VHTVSNNVIYSPETLATLLLVFDQSFSTLVGAGPARDDAWRKEVGIRLAEALMNGYAAGEKDPLMLRRMALTRVAMSYMDMTGTG